MKHPSPIARETRIEQAWQVHPPSWRPAVSSWQTASGRPCSIFTPLHVPRYPRYYGTMLKASPGRRSDHVPLLQGLWGVQPASQPVQLPPPNLGFFSQPSSAPVRRATDPRQQIPPIPSRISGLPRILPPIHLICTGLRVPRSILFRCQSHRDASLFDESLLSVLLDPRHVAPLFILVRGSLRLLPRPSSIAFAFAVEARSSASTHQPPSTARASCLGFTRTSTALPR